METLKAEMSVGVLHDHFLDALATTNCDLMTKEATGLLMKECDKLRGRPNPAHDRRQSEALQQRPTSSSSTDDPADFACESSTTVVKNLSYRRPSEPHSVARAILRVVRSRVRNRQRSSSGRTHSGGAADDKVRFPIVSSANLTAKVDAPNGHARSTSPDKVYEHRGADLPPSSSHINNNDAKHSNANDRWPLARRLSSSPLPVRQHLSYSPGLQQRAPRNRHNFPIDLHKFNSALRRRAQTPPASISQSSPVVNCVNCAKCSSDGGHGVVRPKSLVEAATCSQLTNHSGIFASVDRLHSLRYIDSTTADDAKNEHRLIAFKSALLKTPSYSQTHAGRASCSRANSLAANSKTSLVTDRVTAMIHEEESVHPDHSTGDTTVGAGGGGGDSTSGDGTAASSRDEMSLPDGGPCYFPDGYARAVTGTVSPPAGEPFLHSRNRCCTSYRLRVPAMKNPVDICALPNQCLAIADYDNGFLVITCSGDTVKHCTVADGKNACGVCCSANEDDFRLLVLGYKDGHWSVHVYTAAYELLDTIACPDDTVIETWAIRKLNVGGDGLLYLMATGEHRSVIWSCDMSTHVWKTLVTENSRRGVYNDFDVKYDAARKEIHFLLCDYKKSQLSTVVVTETEELAGIQSIRMRRVKGQEWIVQGPKLAAWDDDDDIVMYDGSGKLFAFDGTHFKCKKIVGDVGKGEVGAIAMRAGWCYALCRYRLCVEAFLYKDYKEVIETVL